MARRVKSPEIIEVGGNLFDLSHFNLDPRRILGIIAVLALVLWFFIGGPVYTVGPDEEAVVLTFGKYTATTGPGLHFMIPWPVQTRQIVNVREVKRIEIGFRSTGTYGDRPVYQSFDDPGQPMLLQEAQMLTGDENVVNCSMAVQFRVTNARDYLFNFSSEADVTAMLKAVTEAALRQSVGDRPIDDALTTGKFAIATEVGEKIQELADLCGAGVTITQVLLQDVQPPREVADAFREVATAREERERFINEAQAYENEMLPRAQGMAERLRLEAQGYKEARIAEAEGEVARFLALAVEHRQTPDLTEKRLYLETMKELLPKLRITIVDDKAGIVNLKPLGGGLPVQAPAGQRPAQGVTP